LAKIPGQSPAPADVSASSALMTVLRAAQQFQKKDGDSFLTVDHVLKALAVDSGTVKDALKEGGLTPEKLEEAVKELRGNQKVNSKSAGTFSS
jgi:ATP-dependent Clp protease ATP-binding subunit ClpB